MTDKPQEGAEQNGQRRQPKQARSAETYESILKAAAELFADAGYEQTTTHQIAQRASISVGALYRYFSDKQAVLLELYRREITNTRQQLLDQFDITDLVAADVREIIRRTLSLAFDVYSEHAGLRRVLGEQSRKISALVELRREQETELLGAVSRILGAAAEVRLPDVELSAYLVTVFFDGLIEDYVLRQSDPPRFERDRVIDSATDLILRYALGKSER
ncbi:MAG: TetR/AcrR family transcriptional regulator [Deltaproteobacteria bacterium]|jgi:AcrR family transcriptional regulator|nr:TetR/AcrR family transcriptional regulator [Deltaproteobacteria bacterium]MBW2533972.1 TetR/AcrR family transcriptional regulator [Deltaproteobacteria bacterium]